VKDLRPLGALYFPVLKHQDFVLRITPGPGGPRVQALTPIGEGEAPFVLPPDLPTLPEVLGLRRREIELAAAGFLPEDPQLGSAELGARLFEALFPAPIRQMLDESLGRIGGGKSLRLCLVFAAELARLYELPWELLYRPDTFLALSRRIHLVRALDLPLPERTVKLAAPRRVLVVTSVPAHFDRRDLQDEVWLINQTLHRGRCEVVVLEDPDLPALRAALDARPFEILHFSGHVSKDWASGKRVLLLGDPAGARAVSGHELADGLRNSPGLRLVVLNADHTAEVALDLVRAGVPAVVAMQAGIEDRMAIIFSGALYHRLAAGDPVETAVAAARQALHAQAPEVGAWALPILIEGRAGARHAKAAGDQARGHDEVTIERRIEPPVPTFPEVLDRWLVATRGLLRSWVHLLPRGGKPPARLPSPNRFDLLPAWLASVLGLAAGVAAAVALLQGPPAVAVSGFVLLLGLAGWMVATAQPVEAPALAPPVPVAAPERAAEPAPAEPQPPDEAADGRSPALVRDRELVPLPGGVYEMGSPEDEDGHYPRESPVHQVRVSAFECMRYPVTRRLYLAVVGKDPGWPEGSADDRPVNNVSWEDAVRFCNRWSELEGLEPCYEIREAAIIERRAAGGYRLPTEAEWEYACRAGTRTRWSFGDDEAALDRHAWYEANAEGEPQPVGCKEPNPWGLHDMHGNVWEWVGDWDGPYGAEPQVDPVGPGEGEARLLRGGAFGVSPRVLRSAVRGWGEPTGRDWIIGFRCVRVSGREPS
jgi:formylglycine-generating enzyme required for sulfatase activity